MRRKHRRLKSDTDLDITAFMNLMIVLVPVLLLNMVFAHTSVLELNFPETAGGADQAEELQLQVIILDEELVVSDNKGGVIKRIPDKDGDHDFELLGGVMKDIKARVPDKKDIVIMARKQTSYQNLVTVMDTVRSYEAVVAGSVVDAELFPDISIGDAPETISES